MADPGFLGGVDLLGGVGADSRGSYISKILYVEMKEPGLLGGGACAPGTPPRSANENTKITAYSQKLVQAPSSTIEGNTVSTQENIK